MQIDDDGMFEFFRASPDEAYRVELTIDGFVGEVHSDTETVVYASRSVGRFAPEPFEGDLPIRVTSTAPNMLRAGVASTGVWAYASGIAVLAPFAMNWRNPTSATPRHGIVDPAKGDALYVLEYELRSTQGKSYVGIAGHRREYRKLAAMGETFDGVARMPLPAPCRTLVGAHAQERERLRSALASPRPDQPCSEDIAYCPAFRRAAEKNGDFARYQPEQSTVVVYSSMFRMR